MYDRGSAFEFDNWYADPEGFGPGLQDITNPTVGNHEYMLQPNDAAPYFAYWGNVPHYYSYDVGGWHVVVLDSTMEFKKTSDPTQLEPGSPQYEWLAADLAAHQGTCMLAYMHHPRYSAVQGVERPDLAEVWSLLVDRNVTMVLTGHAHTYERWISLDSTGSPVAGGLTQFIVGTGGREIQNPELTEPKVAARVTTPGALRLDLGRDDAAFTFASTDGSFTDSGTVPCRRPAPPPPPPDTSAPSTPVGVTAAATSPTAARVSWAASTDNAGVTGYTVRRGGAVVATLGAGSTSYADTRLHGGTAYSWTVEAVDAAGNRSAPSAPATARTPFPTVSSRTLLRGLTRTVEHRRGFSARRFGNGWTDADRDGCSTFAEVLVAEAVRPPAVRAGCAISGGRWRSPYDGVVTATRTRLVVDHLVPLREAWESGAHRWHHGSRRQLANDLGYDPTLTAVTRSSARAKAGAEPQDWLPTRTAYRCTYLARWVAVKWRWHLSVDRAEARFLSRRLSSCGWPAVVQPTRPAVR